MKSAHNFFRPGWDQCTSKHIDIVQHFVRQLKFVSAVSTSEFHEQIKNLKNKSLQMKETTVFIFSAHNFTATNAWFMGRCVHII